jgi:hypothetical protein
LLLFYWPIHLLVVPNVICFDVSFCPLHEGNFCSPRSFVATWCTIGLGERLVEKMFEWPDFHAISRLKLHTKFDHVRY